MDTGVIVAIALGVVIVLVFAVVVCVLMSGDDKSPPPKAKPAPSAAEGPARDAQAERQLPHPHVLGRGDGKAYQGLNGAPLQAGRGVELPQRPVGEAAEREKPKPKVAPSSPLAPVQPLREGEHLQHQVNSHAHDLPPTPSKQQRPTEQVRRGSLGSPQPGSARSQKKQKALVRVIVAKGLQNVGPDSDLRLGTRCRALGSNGQQIGEEVRWPAAFAEEGLYLVWNTVRDIRCYVQDIEILEFALVSGKDEVVAFARVDGPFRTGLIMELQLQTNPKRITGDGVLLLMLAAHPAREKHFFFLRSGLPEAAPAERNISYCGLSQQGCEQAEDVADVITYLLANPQRIEHDILRRTKRVLSAPAVRALQTALIALSPLSPENRLSVSRYARASREHAPEDGNTLLRATEEGLHHLYADTPNRADGLLQHAGPIDSQEADSCDRPWNETDEDKSLVAERVADLMNQLRYSVEDIMLLVASGSVIKTLLSQYTAVDADLGKYSLDEMLDLSPASLVYAKADFSSPGPFKKVKYIIGTPLAVANQLHESWTAYQSPLPSPHNPPPPSPLDPTLFYHPSHGSLPPTNTEQPHRTHGLPPPNTEQPHRTHGLPPPNTEQPTSAPLPQPLSIPSEATAGRGRTLDRIVPAAMVELHRIKEEELQARERALHVKEEQLMRQQELAAREAAIMEKELELGGKEVALLLQERKMERDKELRLRTRQSLLGPPVSFTR